MERINSLNASQVGGFQLTNNHVSTPKEQNNPTTRHNQARFIIYLLNFNREKACAIFAELS